MTTPQTIQGSWEEIVEQSHLFRDRKDLLLVIPKIEPTIMQARPTSLYQEDGYDEEQERFHTIVAQLFAECDALERVPGKPLSDPYESAVEKIIIEKHRKLGLEI